MQTTQEKHTLGPWKAEANGLICDPNGTPVCHILDNPDSGLDTLGQEQSDYNEALIAAAPDLLAGLKDVMGWIKNWDVPFDEDREWHQSKQDIEAAILKAEGGQP